MSIDLKPGTLVLSSAASADEWLAARRDGIGENCLAWAIESKQAAGILGGLTKKERNALKRKAANYAA